MKRMEEHRNQANICSKLDHRISATIFGKRLLAHHLLSCVPLFKPMGNLYTWTDPENITE